METLKNNISKKYNLIAKAVLFSTAIAVFFTLNNNAVLAENPIDIVKQASTEQPLEDFKPSSNSGTEESTAISPERKPLEDVSNKIENQTLSEETVSQAEAEKDVEALANAKLNDEIPTHGFRATIYKFLKVMVGVALSSVMIFLGLTIYNKFFILKRSGKIKDYANTLETPKTVEDALNIFIEKTKLD